MALALTLVAAGCGREASQPAVSAAAGGMDASAHDAAVERALEWLASVQDQDGGFHSEHYGALRAGASTTAIVLAAATAAATPQARARHAPMLRRAFAFLGARIGDDGGIVPREPMPDYPTYTAAFLLQALARARPEEIPAARAEAHRTRLVAWLQSQQLTAARGWSESDPEHGGFSFGAESGHKPRGADLLNLSATTAAVEGLRAAGVHTGDAALRHALAFVRRCQLGAAGGADAGGFTFTLPGRGDASKAGYIAEPDGGQRVPRPYGPPTADGLRALLACGAPPDDPAVQGARAWLERHFTVERTPGFPADQEPPLERALRFYWYAAAARALAVAGVEGAWREQLTAKLLALQHADGAWVGASDWMKEDDPLVATPLALLALAACRARARAR